MNINSELVQLFIKNHPQDVAILIENFPVEELVNVITNIPADSAAATLKCMIPSIAGLSLFKLDFVKRKNILNLLPNDVITLLISSFDLSQKDVILESLNKEQAELLRVQLSYPVGSAGYLMDASITPWHSQMKSAEVISEISKNAKHISRYLYIIDRSGKLVGVLSHRELMMHDKKSTLESIMHTHLDTLSANATSQDIVIDPGWKRFYALPVIDKQGNFLGAIRYKILRKLEVELDSNSGNSLAKAMQFGELCLTGMLAVCSAMVQAIDSKRMPRE